MKIEELRGRDVKICPNSLTCKENGKTKGVVTNAVRYTDLKYNKQTEYYKSLRLSGALDAGEGNKFFVIDNKLYYLCNIAPFEYYEKYFSGKPGFEREAERVNVLKAVAEAVAKFATVIPCYIL